MRSINPRKQVLMWKSDRGWERVRPVDLEQYLYVIGNHWDRSTIFKVVKGFIRLAEEEGLKVILGRYFDTWEYEQENKPKERISCETSLR